MSPLLPVAQGRAGEFRVDVVSERDTVRLCAVGEVDIATVDRFRQQLDELIAAGFKRVIFDLRRVTFLDSTGLRLIVTAHASSADEGWELAIIPGSQAVQRPFDIAGLTARLPFVDPTAGAWGPLWR